MYQTCFTLSRLHVKVDFTIQSYLDGLRLFLRAFYGEKKNNKLLDAYWKLSLAIDATYKQVEDSGFKSR